MSTSIPPPGSERDRALARFMAKVEKTPTCWLWTASLSPRGYGCFRLTGTPRRTRRAHRIAYEFFIGPVIEDLVIDHTCHNSDANCPGGDNCMHRRCVNPAHLQAVTSRTNTLRSPNANIWKTHCPQGHAYDEANTRMSGTRRNCRACQRASNQARFAVSSRREEVR